MRLKPTSNMVSPNALLIVGHPGHELRIFGWVKRLHPITAILTDGGGAANRPRVDLSRHLLEAAGARPSSMFGRASDTDFYRAIIDMDFDFFEALGAEIVHIMIDADVHVVVGDAIEGYSPTHDICRVLIDRSVGLAERILERHIENYAFRLTDEVQTEPNTWESREKLDLPAFREKIVAAMTYARNAGGRLEAEIAEFLVAPEATDFANETLFVSDTSSALKVFETTKPYYEVCGEDRVASGQYETVIRYRDHVAPLAKWLLIADFLKDNQKPRCVRSCP
jgi:hypothetical protein